jgi:GT2 family glycosyltransferase
MRELDALPSASSVVTVVIVTHGSWSLTEKCLESLSDQRADLLFDVIVVDNASDDDTPERIRRAFPWIHLFDQRENTGFAKANNRALGAVATPYVLLLNPDTELPPGALRSVVQALEDRPEAGMLGCKLVRPNGELDHACKRGFPRPASALSYFLRLDRTPVGRWLGGAAAGAYVAAHLGADEEGFVDAINGAFMLVRQEALGEVGLLDEGYWMYGEDLDWCFRFWAAKWPVFYWPGVEVTHVKGGSAGSRRGWQTNRAFHAAMWRFYKKHYWHTYPRSVGAAVWLAVWVRCLLSAGAAWQGRRIAVTGAQRS